MAKIKIVELTNTDPDFYPTLGPFLAHHDVHRTLGGVPWDEPTKTWLVATAGRQVVGFCAINQQRRRTLLESLYVAPDGDHTRTAQQLVRGAVDRFGHDRDLHATVRTEIAQTIHQPCGFAPVKTTTNFTTLVRPASIRKDADD